MCGKNWILHHNRITRDINLSESEWDAGEYFDAGVDMAYALVELVGPVPPS